MTDVEHISRKEESESPEPVEMTANRPFIFAITERETGTILFLGRLTDPS